MTLTSTSTSASNFETSDVVLEGFVDIAVKVNVGFRRRTSDVGVDVDVDVLVDIDVNVDMDVNA